jgi:serine/threonine protein kinase
MEKENKENIQISVADIPQSARALTSLGNKTARAVFDLFATSQVSLFPMEDNPLFQDLADSLRRKKWSDEESALLLKAYKEMKDQGRDIEIKSVIRWILAHDDEAAAQSVIDCMSVIPPDEIDILKVLSRKGSQKIVFLASWRLRQQEVVLKRVIGSEDLVQRIMTRELQPHPLNMVHPNIIETHVLRNNFGESFLVERKLPIVYSDAWRANGTQEAASLLFDIAQAIKFLHDHGLVHGDIKPDNIGKRGDNFVLLDFGICRPAEEFTRESTPTGSIRTRAPELLAEDGYIDPTKVDVWALGATIFNSLIYRFPLISEDEAIPRISSPKDRQFFERRVALRAQTEWDKWVTLDTIAEPLKHILSRMLEINVDERITASDLVRMAETQLSAFIPSASQGTGRFSPIEEFQQIQHYLKDERNIPLLPRYRKQQLTARLNELKTVHGFDEEEKKRIEELVITIN